MRKVIIALLSIATLIACKKESLKPDSLSFTLNGVKVDTTSQTPKTDAAGSVVYFELGDTIKGQLSLQFTSNKIFTYDQTGYKSGNFLKYQKAGKIYGLNILTTKNHFKVDIMKNTLADKGQSASETELTFSGTLYYKDDDSIKIENGSLYWSNSN